LRYDIAMYGLTGNSLDSWTVRVVHWKKNDSLALRRYVLASSSSMWVRLEGIARGPLRRA